MIENDEFVTEDSDLLGAIIKGGTQTTQSFAYGDYDTNGTEPDPFPEDPADPDADATDYWLNFPPSMGNFDGKLADADYNYDHFDFG